MLEQQVTALTAILKDRDIRKFAGDSFWSIIKAVSFGDPAALAEAADDMKQLIFHMPAVLFWDKMQRYLFGTFRSYEDQVRMAQKFTRENADYAAFVKKQMHLVNELNDDRKIDDFAQLTRCYLLTELDEALYDKLARYLNICTAGELAYLRTFGYDQRSALNVMISALYQYGLFDQTQDERGGTAYVLSGFGKALKLCSLNFDEGCGGMERITSYGQLTPLNIAEPASMDEIEEMFHDTFDSVGGGGADSCGLPE